MALSKIFIIDGNLYSSPNSASPPPPVKPDLLEFADTFLNPIPDMLRILYSNHFPFLPFIPLPMRLEGPLFGRLSHISSTVPIERDLTGSHLAACLQKSWKELEDLLEDIISIVGGDQVFPLGTAEPFPSPEKYGYLRSFPTTKVARRQIIRSRDAFFPLVGRCSWLIMRAGFTQHDFPIWRFLMENSGAHMSYIDDIAASVVANFTVARQGVLIDPSECKWLKDVPMYLKANVNVWFCWGQVDAPITCPDLVQKYLPTREELNMALAWLSNDHSQQSSTTTSFPRSELNHPCPEYSAPHAPEPEKFSGQRQGETWEEFFVRREKRNTVRAARESPEEKNARLAREEHNRIHPIPGRSSKSPVVFEWIHVDDFLIRQRVARNAVEDVFTSYGMTTRRYDSFANKWDLNYAFDSNPNAPADDDDDDDDNDNYFRPPPPIVPSVQSSTVFPPRSSSPVEFWPAKETSACSLEYLDAQYDTNILQSDIEPPQFDDMLYFHYGFITDISDGSAVDLNEWRRLCAELGHRGSPTPVPSSHVIEFFKNLWDPKAVPENIWDLSFSNSNSLAVHQNHDIRIILETLEHSQQFYIIESALVNANWKLVVWQAATALHCLRETEIIVWDIARRLLRLGIPFNTLLAGFDDIPNPTFRPTLGLGWRPQNYDPDLNDFARYEKVRDAFFRQPHARAALLKGGIIWRLAVDSLDVTDALAGPSDFVFDHG